MATWPSRKGDPMPGIRKRARSAALLTAASVALLGVSAAHAAESGGETQTYLVVYSAQSVPSNTAASISSAGGSIVSTYGQIGVVVARSSTPTFRATLMKNPKIQAVSKTAAFATQLTDGAVDTAQDTPDPGTPAPGADPLSGLQWDMNQIHAPEARAINGGSRSVIVGDIDTGADYTHPDLAANIDDATSVNCVSGAPVPGKVAANDDNGHGTHTAGTIAAAKNDIGIVGVAPNVRIAAIKAGNALGYFFPESVVCAFMWAGTHNIPVTNNSYFADPWLFNCKNDPAQRAIWMAEQRAILFAESRGTVVIAAEGNEADDLAHPTQDVTSPDDSEPIVRTVHNNCAVVPVEVAGVVGVTADGNRLLKSFYSSYGVGKADVTAPGGDSILQLTAAAPNGRVLSTYPASVPCARPVIDASGATYCYLQGTSMAAPHAAGVAALLASSGVTTRGAIVAALENGADPLACPADMSIYAFFPSTSNGAPQVCQGGPGSNSFYGKGQVNALTAVNR